jgi:hypothetical protein
MHLNFFFFTFSNCFLQPQLRGLHINMKINLDMLMQFLSGDMASSEMSVSGPAKQERPAEGWPAEPPPTLNLVKCL